MDLLGIGPLELVLVLILALLIFGPEDLVSAGKKMGKFFNRVVKSETWMAVRSISREMRNLPNKLVREAELDELSKEIENQTIVPPTYLPSDTPAKDTDSGDPEKLKAWTSPPSSGENGEDSEVSPKPETPNEEADEHVSD